MIEKITVKNQESSDMLKDRKIKQIKTESDQWMLRKGESYEE